MFASCTFQYGNLYSSMSFTASVKRWSKTGKVVFLRTFKYSTNESIKERTSKNKLNAWNKTDMK